ncbi:MAG: Uma2 family endonuclease [Okeania sp. SIO2F4]|uniref:Uma2 family endonuclease n=1 Tax=Okeania sp. SIO2F4 TaxID=2607790 RepID=UPI00142BED9C|nr:Uma2 family endonuclease [Okeania sp. SIO2F4]NES05464.1 Uma2 family endonuclease [Okeania sp. SIO2F4]
MSTSQTPISIENNPKFFDNQPEDFEFTAPDLSDVITEDYTSVDNLITEKQQRLLTTTLYSSFSTNLPFLATANVGLFYGNKIPPLVPDVLLSLRVKVPEDWSEKKNRSYFVFSFGKPPEVAIEIVSNKIGNELGNKLQDYAFAAVGYYVVFDPLKQLGETIVRVYELRGNSYVELQNFYLPQVGLGLTIWHGIFEGKEYDWLRWCDDSGNILLTGDERAEQERQRAEQEKQRADRLAEILRERGINPDEIL